MKVVINTCYGGFELSAMAIKRIMELQGRECYFFSHEYKDSSFNPTYSPINPERHTGYFDVFDIPNPNQPTEDGKDHYICLEFELERNDSLLIQAVEELGEKANGSCAKLKIIEIPDDLDYYIDDYDGMETIHEKHESYS